MSRGRRIFVGDLQGCREPLERLLEAVRFDDAADRLLVAGDVVNKGPDNAGAIRLVRDVGGEAVLGNHDVHLLDAAAGRSKVREGDTFGDVLAADDRDELLGWLRARPLLVVFDDVVLVHAGMHPDWTDPVAWAARLRERFEACLDRGESPLRDEAVRFALTVRYCTPDGEISAQEWPPPGPPYSNWMDLYRGKRTVVFGHHARQGFVRRGRAIGLDSGCVYGNALSAWIAEEDRVVGVPGMRSGAG